MRAFLDSKTESDKERNAQIMDDQDTFPTVISVDLGGTQLRVAVQRGCKILSQVRVSTGQAPTPDRLIPRIHDAIQQALDKASMSLENIEGIGIGVAGPLDSQTGMVFASPNLEGWHDVPLLDIFKETYASYEFPIYLENDANAAGLGEYIFGAGQGSKNFVYLTISTGIGGCVIVDGNLLRGTSGTAAELGHMVIDWNGEPCNCGNVGCLESIASGTAIARRAQEALDQGAYLSSVRTQLVTPKMSMPTSKACGSKANAAQTM